MALLLGDIEHAQLVRSLELLMKDMEHSLSPQNNLFKGKDCVGLFHMRKRTRYISPLPLGKSSLVKRRKRSFE